MYQSVFKRYEIKYLLSDQQLKEVMLYIDKKMDRDMYYLSNIRSLYFDTDSFLMIRRSIEKPVFKEKLRIRGYGDIKGDTTVFAEIKRKYKGIVYKRRIALPYDDACDWLKHRSNRHPVSQISKEIDYLYDYYGLLSPAMCISYSRKSFLGERGLRITIDKDILARRESLDLQSGAYGARLIEDGQALMEIKCVEGIPLYLSRILSEAGIFKTGFSKYGRAFSLLVDKKELFSEDFTYA